MGMGIEVIEKWKWECSVGMEISGNSNGNDSTGMGREWEQTIIPAHLHTALTTA